MFNNLLAMVTYTDTSQMRIVQITKTAQCIEFYISHSRRMMIYGKPVNRSFLR